MKFNLILLSICDVAKYRDNEFIKKVGGLIREIRESRKLSLEDVAAMTGFTIATLGEIERSEVNTDISHVAAIGQAFSMHPMKLLDVYIELKPRFDLPPNRENRASTTLRVKELVETDYFNDPRTVTAVIEYVKTKQGISLESSPVSGVLKNLVEEGLLEYSKSGRNHVYQKVNE
ncbi:MAG TPA: helix-turn-helix transcriptional regulator [Sphingobacteriaceae bacterium]|nr:helix-turn-helix transcriptional regulator [Sphingobacteriaceae bacterium]